MRNFYCLGIFEHIFARSIHVTLTINADIPHGIFLRTGNENFTIKFLQRNRHRLIFNLNKGDLQADVRATTIIYLFLRDVNKVL